MKNKMMAIGMVALGILGTGSCSSDDDGPARAELKVTLNNLEQLQEGFQYEGWIMVDGNAISTGKFNDVSANTVKTFSPIATDLEKATEFVLSIEPANDTDSGPSNTKVLSGSFNGNAASLSYQTVIGDLQTSEGRFTLGTPTDNVADNDEAGVWFEANGQPGLTLPELPEGWKYEGWVVFNNIPVSTFKFKEVDMADEANAYSGTVARPSFPGEDFLFNTVAPDGVTFPEDVRGKTVVISVEPEPDDSKAPFFIKPLILEGKTEGGVPTPNTGVVNAMNLNSASFPQGFATR